MTTDWPVVAQRVADALTLQQGMLVLVRERSGRHDATGRDPASARTARRHSTD